MEMKQSFSTSEVARYCHVTADTIRKWAEAGRISVFKTPGGHRRIRREELLRFLQDNSIPIHGELNAAGLKVLVVDEDASVYAVVDRFLTRLPGKFEVKLATDGFDAGHMLAIFDPDIIFLTLGMNGVDGLDVCRRIKQHSEHATANVLIVNPFEDASIQERALQSGASVCLRKPFTPDDLRRGLARVGVDVG